jgi:hypothetical protein
LEECRKEKDGREKEAMKRAIGGKENGKKKGGSLKEERREGYRRKHKQEGEGERRGKIKKKEA